MHGVSNAALARTIETARTDVRDTEQSFGSILGEVAKLLWPDKTAAHIAAAAGCSERAAEFYLAGGREWSSAALAAIIAEVLKRHGMRNFSVKSKS